MDKENLIRDGERLDDLQLSGLKILQDPKRFCFGMDAVLLSSFARVRPGERVMDLGTGNGIIPLLLSAKTKGKSFCGIEIQPEIADMAKRSIVYNEIGDRVRIFCGDLREAPQQFGASSFDVITSNPPYMIAGHGLLNPADAKAIARHEITCTLEDVVQTSAALLREKGRCYFVHRPFRMAELFSLMSRYHLEPKRMRLVYPYIDKEPNMVLVEGIAGANPRLTVEKPLIVYNPDGSYREEIHSIYGY